MERRDTRDLYNGFGTTLALAFEFAMTPLLFAWIGYLLDGWLGTDPVFMVALAALAAVGMFLRVWYGYVAAMKAEEAKAPWRR